MGLDEGDVKAANEETDKQQNEGPVREGAPDSCAEAGSRPGRRGARGARDKAQRRQDQQEAGGDGEDRRLPAQPADQRP